MRSAPTATTERALPIHSLCRSDLAHESDRARTCRQIASLIISAVQHVQFHRTHRTGVSTGDRTPRIRSVLHVCVEAARAQRFWSCLSRLGAKDAHCLNENPEQHENQKRHVTSFLMFSAT